MEHVALLYGWVMGYIYIASKCMYAKLLQPCLTLCHSMDHSLPGSSVHGILHARVLEWVAMSSYRGSSWPRSRTMSLVSCIGRWVLYHQCHLGSPGGKSGGKDKLRNWEWHIQTTIHKITNKDLLYSTGNSTQCSVMTYVRKESKEWYVFMYNWAILLYSRNWHNIVNQLMANKY